MNFPAGLSASINLIVVKENEKKSKSYNKACDQNGCLCVFTLKHKSNFFHNLIF
jgi:hypothetical protein